LTLSQHQPKARRIPLWIIGIAGLALSGVVAILFMLLIGISALNSDRILNGVTVGGMRLGGLTRIEASSRLATRWPVLMLTDSETGRQWQVSPEQLGVNIDATASVERAYRYGREDGNFVAALMGRDLSPIVSVNLDQARSTLVNFQSEIDIPARDAGVAFANGQVLGVDSSAGRLLNVEQTLQALNADVQHAVIERSVSLLLDDVAPAISDPAPLVAAARAVLNQSLTVDLYDPQTGSITAWSVGPETWAGWLSATPDPSSSTGLRLQLDSTALRGFLQPAESQLGANAYLNPDEIITALQSSLAQNSARTTARVYHRDWQYTVQSGETIISIAWKLGIPYPWIQQANGGAQGISVGQSLTIPSVDKFLQYDPVPNKRIVVSISQQRVRVYENGALKWDWAASTGINDSPTWPGVYQIISHVPNAYAGNWNLWMPSFMGVYQPIPGADFTNGFHGFPTRGGGQILWENSLGHKVTYGCILLSNTNVQMLYDWAETGVVVEIQA
jgi:hypothetical protein